jgi:hypothetical protein
MRFLMSLAFAGCTSVQSPATFTEVFDDVLSQSCAFSTCHGGSAGAPFLRESQAAYESLVDVESNSKENAILVVPGNPDESYLIQKIENSEGIDGESMPPSSPLTDETIERIRSWIEDGAQQN